MRYRWPLRHPDPVLDEALDIALKYLEATGQAEAEDDTKLQAPFLQHGCKGQDTRYAWPTSASLPPSRLKHHASNPAIFVWMLWRI
jgi:hypothetical protein